MKENKFVHINFGTGAAKQFAQRGYNIVAIDVLRATSTITVALEQGATEVIPCVDIAEAHEYKDTEGALLIGERHAIKVEGFDFTNSPHDLANADVRDKVLAITTSDGTKLIAASKAAPHVLIASVLNAHAVALEMERIGGNWAILGAGTKGEFVVEDQVGCVLVAQEAIALGANSDPYSLALISTLAKDWEHHIRTSKNAAKLESIGRQIDVEYVVKGANTFSVVPEISSKTDTRIGLTNRKKK